MAKIMLYTRYVSMAGGNVAAIIEVDRLPHSAHTIMQTIVDSVPSYNWYPKSHPWPTSIYFWLAAPASEESKLHKRNWRANVFLARLRDDYVAEHGRAKFYALPNDDREFWAKEN